MLSESIKKLVQYGIETGLTPACEKNYTTNLLLDVFKEDEYTEPAEEYSDINLEEVLKELLDEAVERGLIQDSVVYRDLFDTRLMNCLMPRPAQVQKSFWEKYEKSPEEATDYFYKLSQDSDYIRRYRVKKDGLWILLMEQLILQSTFLSQRKIRKLLLRQSLSNQAAIPNVCFVRKMRDMQAAQIILQERITESFRSQSMTVRGECSTLLMFIIMSIVLYLISSTHL